MNSAEQVAKIIADGKANGSDLQAVAWDAALACVGWAYVFGARGQYCTPSNRRARYSDAHPTIKTACKNYAGSDSSGCKGCKWYPGQKLTRVYDCRGFTYWILKQVYGWELMGSGATSQWNDKNNWTAKGEIATMPKDVLCCLFVKKGTKMEHTGFGLNGETIECSAGVQHFKTRNKKWTHWGVPKCVAGEVVPGEPAEPAGKPELKKGAKGSWVQKAQTMLISAGYSCGKSGVDGIFGNDTLAAVKAFQRDQGLSMDGIVGAATWAALENPQSIQLYTVTIPKLPLYKAEALAGQYTGATMKKE